MAPKRVRSAPRGAVEVLGTSTVGQVTGSAYAPPKALSQAIVERVREGDDPPRWRIKAGQPRTNDEDRAWLRTHGWGWSGREWWHA